jgi:uncharacterized membrane protein YgdD (TMEM256/DUF423 family)
MLRSPIAGVVAATRGESCNLRHAQRERNARSKDPLMTTSSTRAATAATAAAAALGFAGVALGAFGAHALKDYFDSSPGERELWNTAVLYNLIHAVAALWAARGIADARGRAPRIAAWSFVVGSVLFSGSLYVMGATNVSLGALGAVTPIGGVCFLIGWTATFVSALSGTAHETVAEPGPGHE